jgi:glutamine amidotransferase-like uncharacterized protein
MISSLSPNYNFKLFTKEQVCPELFEGIDIVAFPGGIGDADSYDRFFRRRAQNAVADFVANGGYYLGICMGAYWAGRQYFDILDSVNPEQYIKRTNADIRRSYGTVASVNWQGTTENMYFYDGCALVGDESKFTTVARYVNGDPMAIIQGRIGIIGCHPESQEYWYGEPYQYIKQHWHHGHHNQLLLKFVNQLVSSN